MKITIWKMTALLAVHLASSLLPAAGAVKGIRAGDSLPCCMRAVLKGQWGEGGSNCQSAPWRIHCTPLFLYIFTSYFLVWSTLRLLERIFQKGFLFLNNIMGHFAFFFSLHHIVTSSLECDGFDSIYFQIKP